MTISNTDETIDSRDVIARIEELEEEREELVAAEEEAEEAALTAEQEIADADVVDGERLKEVGDLRIAANLAATALSEWDNGDDAEELKALKALQDQAEGYSDWQHGAQLISDYYFEDYARDLAEDLHGSAVRNVSWPFDCIDWKQAAEALQQDYTSVDFDGNTYWVR
jgi:hypothetical protein